MKHNANYRWEREMFTSKDTGLTLVRCVEVQFGCRTQWFEVRRKSGMQSWLVWETDDYHQACDYANGWL